MNVWSKAQELTDSKKSFVLVTLTQIRGSAPQDIGAKMLVTSEGLYFGTVGGGKVEMAAIKKAQAILEHREPRAPEAVKWNLQTDIGMSCGGEVQFLFEHFPLPSWSIVIFGAGHVSQALTRLLSKLKCQVTCIDPREEWVQKLQGVTGVYHPHPSEVVKRFSSDCFFLSMTMGHAHDVPILKAVFEHAPECPYVGVIGSEIKGAKIRKELKEMGVSDQFLEKLRVPVGLNLGSNDPEEIAISIAAECLIVRDALIQSKGTST